MIEREYRNTVEIGEREREFLGREGFIDERRYIEPMRKRGGRKKNLGGRGNLDFFGINDVTACCAQSCVVLYK